MRKHVIYPGSDDTTRERILKAAMLRFSAQSYEETGLRDIAADVGVDMAYVHRSFGSKEKLFYEAVKAVWQPERIFAGEANELPSVLVQDILVERAENEIYPFDIFIHSFSSPDASRVLHKVFADSFITPLMNKRAGLSEKRAALAGAVLAGVGILRDVIRADALQEGMGGELELLVTQIVAGLLEGGFVDDTMTQEALAIQEKTL